MRVLILCEHDGKGIRLGSRSAVAFANAVEEQTRGSVECLLLGHSLATVAQDAAAYAPVLVADHPALANPVADRYAKVITDLVKERGFDLVVAAATTFAKDILPRAAGVLGGAMASEVIGHEFREGRLCFRRPLFAGAVVATVALHGKPQIVTVRPSAYAPASARAEYSAITNVTIDEASLPKKTEFEALQSKLSNRPDVTEARIVISGGRAIKNSEDFERLVGGLADKLHAATGSSRALVDAGITPNAFQVGQTGKVVAPELYIALGISGAVQHLAGMKNSKTIVAINSDPEAPIFEVADYCLVGDVYEIVPQWIAGLNGK
ncbi:MAG: electron transfer flavoprotein subunit alpha/FixB family protein [Verrucomicrobia bacterium]|nr:electron transfer flavoprotein subunit alpha/FixB family protein [Verrucomicrobiota bacterium]